MKLRWVAAAVFAATLVPGPVAAADPAIVPIFDTLSTSSIAQRSSCIRGLEEQTTTVVYDLTFGLPTYWSAFARQPTRGPWVAVRPLTRHERTDLRCGLPAKVRALRARIHHLQHELADASRPK